MPFWSEIQFMSANSPLMEQMILFHDHTLMIITPIMIFIMISLLSMKMNNHMCMNIIENQTMEIIWTLTPMVLLIFIAMPSLRILYLMEETMKPSLTIKTIGHQWYWSYEYSDFNINFEMFMDNEKKKNMFRLLDTDNYLSVPMNTLTRMLITSSDVIHSWTMQSLGVKTDAIPGRLNQISLMPSRPGKYYGQCSEICGSNHSFMPISMTITNMKNFKNFIKTHE